LILDTNFTDGQSHLFIFFCLQINFSNIWIWASNSGTFRSSIHWMKTTFDIFISWRCLKCFPSSELSFGLWDIGFSKTKAQSTGWRTLLKSSRDVDVKSGLHPVDWALVFEISPICCFH
jgi:hypothetical protein